MFTFPESLLAIPYMSSLILYEIVMRADGKSEIGSINQMVLTCIFVAF